MTSPDESTSFRATGAHVHHTWAQTFYSRPELYIQPRSEAEVCKAVILARRCRRRLVVVGSGHSPSILTCSSAWMMNLDLFAQVLRVQPVTSSQSARDRTTAAASSAGAAATPAAIVTVQAGIRLRDLNAALGEYGLTLPNLGSIDEQSLAGAIATGTHGSSLRHGLLSGCVSALKVCLASGEVVRCSADEHADLFRAALVSLGAVGVITELEIGVVKDSRIAWTQRIVPLDDILARWETDLWTTAEFVRVWWLPYTRRAVLWQADRTDAPLRPPRAGLLGGKLWFWTYHSLLALAHYVPRILPTVEWFVYGLQYGFDNGRVESAVQIQRDGLLLDCLFSQTVNEWALPLANGPEAIRRLEAWFHGDDSGIPLPTSSLPPASSPANYGSTSSTASTASETFYAHSPIEVRVSDGSKAELRAYLDPSMPDTPTLYLNAILYRPYGLDPPFQAHYYAGFESLMKHLGGRPHWAKNFATVTNADVKDMYGSEFDDYMRVRDAADPDGLFIGQWHRALLLGSPSTKGYKSLDEKDDFLLLEEREAARTTRAWRAGGGVEWRGEQAARRSASTLSSSGSEESFDVVTSATSYAPSMGNSQILHSVDGESEWREVVG